MYFIPLICRIVPYFKFHCQRLFWSIHVMWEFVQTLVAHDTASTCSTNSSSQPRRLELFCLCRSSWGWCRCRCHNGRWRFPKCLWPFVISYFRRSSFLSFLGSLNYFLLYVPYPQEYLARCHTVSLPKKNRQGVCIVCSSLQFIT
jgi:hypothetical protein